VNGKGDKRRPSSVTFEEYEENWKRIFGLGGRRMAITEFDGEYAFLSNFYPHEVIFEGDVYPSSEHAFQAAKTVSKAERRQIRLASSPGKAKRMGKEVTLQPGWEDMKINVMLKILRLKFKDPKLCGLLLATGDSTLIEGNTWRDDFWGQIRKDGRWFGQNYLGKLLMQVRDEINVENEQEAKKNLGTKTNSEAGRS
jgi:ribA/ribD-fused uncharacterized protein